MEEVKIYLDKDLKQEIGESIEFEQVPAGETTKKKIYIYNTINHRVNVDLELEGENISISKTGYQIESGKVGEVTFEFKPKLTLMQPIRAKLKIGLRYTIR